MPHVASEYRQLAEQCERLASQAEDEQYRSLLIRVAARWSELADQAEACQTPGKNASRERQMPNGTNRILRVRPKTSSWIAELSQH